jgi:hypothetical protein
MSPEAFIYSTVLPAFVMAVMWAFLSHRAFGRKVIPMCLSGAFVAGAWQLAGAPQNVWPMSATSLLLFLSIAAGLLEASLHASAKKWIGILATFVAALFVWFLGARLVASDIWTEDKYLLFTIITWVLLVALNSVTFLGLRSRDSLGLRISLVSTAVALSVITLLSGSALMAQLVGLVVALQCACIATHLVIDRKVEMHPTGLGVFGGILFFLYLLIYFFVDVPKWPMAAVLFSFLSSVILNKWPQSKSALVKIMIALLVSVPAWVAVAQVLISSLADSSGQY